MTNLGVLADTIADVAAFEQHRLNHFDMIVARILACNEVPAIDFSDYRTRLAHLREVEGLLRRMAARPT